MKDSGHNNGEIIQQWDYSSGRNQQWYLDEVEDGYYRIISGLSGKVLTISNSSTVNGTLVVQEDYTGGDNQLWT